MCADMFSWLQSYTFDENGRKSALMMAAEANRHECVSILVANGADVNMINMVIFVIHITCVNVVSKKYSCHVWVLYHSA